MMIGLVSRFSKNERGAIAILFGLLLTLICACTGAAIDFARYTNAKSQTRDAIDAAVLAGARVLLLGGTSAKAISVAKEYYDRNVTDRFQVNNDTVQFQVADNGTSITGTGDAKLPTTLLQLAGINELSLVTVTAAGFPKAQINGVGGDIEISVMLDVTGSMCSDGTGPCGYGPKMDALKAAAKDLVNIVVSDNQSEARSRVALIPFSDRIRVAPNGGGGGIMRSLTDLNPTWSGWREVCTASEYGGTNPVTGGEAPGGGDYHVCTATQKEQVTGWQVRPCVSERYFETSGTFDATDDAPGSNAWLTGGDGSRKPLSKDSGTNPPSTGLGLTAADPMNFWTYNEGGTCEMASQNEIMPLTSDKSVLTSKIDSLTAQRGTAGALGTAFSWYMLSPNFAHIWPSGAAESYSKMTQLNTNGQPKLRKVAILMSDGVYNAMRTGHNSSNQQYISDAAKSMCTGMKAKGIEIYTVGFDLDSLPSNEKAIAMDTLQSCGTTVDHFYNSLEPADLQEAFRDIAVKLSTISLKQ